MDSQISLSASESYVVVSQSGCLSVEKIQSLLQTLTSHSSWASDRRVLFDCRKTESDHLACADIRVISQSFKDYRDSLGAGYCALVTSSERDFGLARMWQLMTEDDLSLTIQVFRSLSEADHWIENQACSGPAGSDQYQGSG